MANTRRLPGTTPAAPSAGGKEVPPSPDVVEHNLAQLIGQAVALHLGELLGPLLAGIAQQQAQPACVLCVQQHKQAQVAQPDVPQDELALPAVMPGITWMPMGQPPVAVPLCYGHVPDGPGMRPTGLVAPDGRPIVAKA